MHGRMDDSAFFDRELAQARVDIIAQDEFHYDFLIELAPAGRWVAFGVT